jgi:hypothetical protein
MYTKNICAILFVLMLSFGVVAQGGLIHRYSFTDGDTAAVDSVGGMNGALTGTATISGNQLVMDGSGGVNLPSNVLDPELQSVTIEFWFETSTVVSWQRVFDFGETVGGNGGNTMFYTPTSGGNDSRFVIGTNGAPSYSTGEDMVMGPVVAVNTPAHVACVYDGGAHQIRLYQDGELLDTISTTMPLSGVSRVFAYIGDSVYTVDPSFNGSIDEFRIYDTALTGEEILASYGEGPDAEITETPISRYPYPLNNSTDVPRDVVLSWEPGPVAVAHDVYLGSSFSEVDSADTSSPLLVSPAQDANTCDVGRLELGQTYFWRVDDINAPPDSTVWKGKVWSFTIEPVSYPIDSQDITATASSLTAGQGPENTINGSGLVDGLHSRESEDMWQSGAEEPGQAWIQYEFDKPYQLEKMLVWNYNGTSILANYGLKEVTIEYSVDAENWMQLDNVPEFAQAPGTNDYASNTTVPFNGVTAKYVKITAISNWGGGLSFFNKYGLSEVVFMHIPVSARQPSPADNSRNVAIDVSLGWRAGREAAEHKVYVSADRQAVIDFTAPVETVSQPSYGPLSLDLEDTYYWRVDEVNNAEATPVWTSSIWNFTTSEYFVVDDFDSYNDIEEAQEGSKLVYLTWVDGFENPATNGSTIGYVELFQPSMETETVHNGSQSVPFTYNNAAASLSEATASTSDLLSGSNWTKGGAGALGLWFYGDPNNSVTEQMYVKINGTKVLYDGDPADIAIPSWTLWIIDLASIGVNQSNVTTLAIGFERMGATGGTGTVLFDDIRLYNVPVDPGTGNLVHSYTFEDGTANDSVGSAHGTLVGDANIADGSLLLDGTDDWMSMPGDVIALNTYSELSIEAWFTSVAGGNTEYHMLAAFGEEGTGASSTAGYKYLFITPARGDNVSRAAIQTSSMDSSPNDEETGVNASTEHDDGLLHHFVCTVNSTSLAFYIDGDLIGVADLAAGNEISGISQAAAYLGKGVYTVDPEWAGAIHEFNIYNKALSPSEVIYLATH